MSVRTALWIPEAVQAVILKKGDRFMCSHCEKLGASRRDLLKFGAAGVVALGLGGLPRRARADAAGAAIKLSPDQALDQLKKGNEAYQAAKQLCTVDDLETQRKQVAPLQTPWATIITCADSRVPPELIFGSPGLGLGQLFVARNAGNLVDTATLGTVEYGAKKLHSPLIVVLGHTSCGAVEAACNVVSEPTSPYPDGAIGPMIDPILAAANAVRNKCGYVPIDFVNKTAEESARRTAARLPASSRILTELVKDPNELKIFAAVYDLESGAVTFFDDATAPATACGRG